MTLRQELREWFRQHRRGTTTELVERFSDNSDRRVRGVLSDMWLHGELVRVMPKKNNSPHSWLYKGGSVEMTEVQTQTQAQTQGEPVDSGGFELVININDGTMSQLENVVKARGLPDVPSLFYVFIAQLVSSKDAPVSTPQKPKRQDDRQAPSTPYRPRASSCDVRPYYDRLCRILAVESQGNFAQRMGKEQPFVSRLYRQETRALSKPNFKVFVTALSKAEVDHGIA